MKKVCTILQIMLLTLVVQVVKAQEANVKSPTNALTTSIGNERYGKLEISKLPVIISESFAKTYVGAKIDEVFVNEVGIHRVFATKDSKNIVAVYFKDGREIPVKRVAEGEEH